MSPRSTGTPPRCSAREDFNQRVDGVDVGRKHETINASCSAPAGKSDALLLGLSGERGPDLSGTEVEGLPCSELGVFKADEAGVSGETPLPRIDESKGDQIMPARCLPPESHRLLELEVADEDRHGTTVQAPDPGEPDTEPRSGRTGGRCDKGSDKLRKVADSNPRIELSLDPIADEKQPNSVSILDRGRGQKSGRLGGAIGLGLAFGPEPHARRDIDHEPENQGPLLDEPADVGPALASRDIPVEVANVVAGFVRAELCEGETDPRPCPVIGPSKQ
jgi:hypothetical protein